MPRSFAPAAAATLLALASQASASLMINNWCTTGVSVVTSHNGGCDSGSDGLCITDGSAPFTLAPGTGSSILNFGWTTDGAGTSIKISKDGIDAGVLQFEYAYTTGEYQGLYWDLSDLDGEGGGLVGTPFAADNVMVTPTGSGVGSGTCLKIKCAANTICYDSYQNPDDENTRYCPLDTGDMWLDLCAPSSIFDVAKKTASTTYQYPNLQNVTIIESIGPNDPSNHVAAKNARHVAAHRNLHGRSGQLI